VNKPRYRYDNDKPRVQYTASELLECVRREAKTRRRVYPNHVETGRYTAAWADRQIAMMDQIAQWLELLAQGEKLFGERA
jgi:hypothetical protein